VLESAGDKVVSVDVSPDGKWISSACFDRTFKLWTAESEGIADRGFKLAFDDYKSKFGHDWAGWD